MILVVYEKVNVRYVLSSTAIFALIRNVNSVKTSRISVTAVNVASQVRLKKIISSAPVLLHISD
jgi:hypothetical protein